MKIALIGHGKMGKTIESLLQKNESFSASIEIESIIDSKNKDSLKESLSNADVAIEFTNAQNVVQNLMTCLEANVPVVTGTTGWYDEFSSVESAFVEKNGALFYASNFSLGVNLFYALNSYLASLMDGHTEYKVGMTEIHHSEKIDSPSGTAITLAEQLLQYLTPYEQWVNNETVNASEIPIISQRIGDEKGTHQVIYTNEMDQIEITHKAFNRDGFAKGAIKAAQWIQGKTGLFTMQDMLQIN